jgi:hypothetical protein
MKNKLELLDTVEGWIAVFTGETGMGEQVSAEEAHNIAGDTDVERTDNALDVLGDNSDETTITIS